LLRNIAFKPEAGGPVGLSVEMATIILEKLMFIKAAIIDDELATYELGDKERGRPPWLETLLEQIPPIRL